MKRYRIQIGLAVTTVLAALIAFAADPPYPNRIQLSASPVGGITVDEDQIVGRLAGGDTDGLDADDARSILEIGDPAPSGAISGVPLVLRVPIPATVGATTFTPSVALTVVDAWAVSTYADSVETLGTDTIQVSVGGSVLTDAMAWTPSVGYLVRAGQFTPTVGVTAANTAWTLTSTSTSATTATGFLYLLGYR